MQISWDFNNDIINYLFSAGSKYLKIKTLNDFYVPKFLKNGVQTSEYFEGIVHRTWYY